MPTFLGAIAGLYLAAVCLAGTATEKWSWIPQVIGALAGLLWVTVGLLMLGQRIRWSAPIMMYAFYFMWGCTGFLVTINFNYFYIIWQTALKVLIVTFVLLQCTRTRKDFMFCCLAIACAAVIVAIAGRGEILKATTFSGSAKDSFGEARASGTLLANANNLGMFAVLSILSGVACFLCYRSLIIKIIGTLAGIAGLYMVVASGSRTAMVGTFIGAVALYWIHFRKAAAGNLGKRLMIILIATAGVGGAVYFVAKSPFFFRLAEVASNEHAREREPRYVYFFRALESTAEHPIVGLGWGGFAIHRLGTNARGQGQYSHSTVSETMSTVGIPGFLLYYGGQFLLFLLIQRVRKKNLSPPDRTAVNLIMTLFIIWNAFSVIAVLDQHRLMWPLWGCICGYLWNLERTYAGTTAPQYVVVADRGQQQLSIPQRGFYPQPAHR